jgi:hypothetical protein
MSRSSTAVARRDERDSWVEVASDLTTLANQVCQTVAVPTAIKGKPNDVLAILLTGRDFGLTPLQSLRTLNIIEGRVCLSAEGADGLLRAHGHEVRVVTYSDVAAVLEGRRAEDRDTDAPWLRVAFTREDAMRAGLWNKVNVVWRDGKKTEKPSPWVLHPADMLMARAKARLAKLLAPDVLLGLPHDVEVEDEAAGEESGVTPAPSTVQPPRVPRKRAAVAASVLAQEAAAEAPGADVVDAVIVEESEAPVRAPRARPARPVDVAAESAPPAPEEASEPTPGPVSAASAATPGPLQTDSQRRRLWAALQQLGRVEAGDRHEWAGRVLGHTVTTLSGLTIGEAARLIDAAEADIRALDPEREPPPDDAPPLPDELPEGETSS